MEPTFNGEDDRQADSSRPAESRKRPRNESRRSEHVYPRKRAVAACRLCRHRKVKCNNQRPICGACAAANAGCFYDDAEDHSAFDSASLKILERLDQVLSKLDQLPLPNYTASPAATMATEGQANGHFSGATMPSREWLSHGQEGADDESWNPAARTTLESVFTWPIFGETHQTSLVVDAIYEAETEEAGDRSRTSAAKLSTAKARPVGILEEDIPRLVQRFIEFVHLKNPVVDVDTLWSYTQQVVEDGIDWSPASCLVLLTCALGSIAQSYSAAIENEIPQGLNSLTRQSDELASGAAYYNLACRRFGLLDKGLLAPQCYFLAGVYSMYTLKPVQAWTKFQQASQYFHIYLTCHKRLRSTPSDTAHQTRRRHLEQRIYWSCYKVECELRVELDLPCSSLSTSNYLDMHPSPPDLLIRNAEISGTSPESAGSPASAASRRIRESRAHLEASWFYYLTEITLRRIEDKVLRFFYNGHNEDWRDQNIPSMVSAASQFELQLDLCLEQLPLPLRQSENDELTLMIRARIFECQCWVYRPFLYYAIHAPTYATNRIIAQPFIDKAIAQCVENVKTGIRRHRHHGTWFDLRFSSAMALTMIAIGRCEALRAKLDHDWLEQMQRCIVRLKYWQDECPGVAETIQILEGQIG